MTEDRLLLRPADPTRRPRFDDAPGTRIDHDFAQRRTRGLLRVVLALLVLVTAAAVALTVMQMIPWWSAAIAGGVLVVYLIGLRRAEIERRNRAARAARIARQEAAAVAKAAREREIEEKAKAEERARREQDAAQRALEAPAADAVRPAPGEWTPRPVPVPAYRLRGEVEDMGSRHASHRESILGRPQRFEREDVEEQEARDEAEAQRFAPALDLNLDEILARRRGA